MPPAKIRIVQRCSLSQLPESVGLSVLLPFAFPLFLLCAPSALSHIHSALVECADKGHGENDLLCRLLLENVVGLSEFPGGWESQ